MKRHLSAEEISNWMMGQRTAEQEEHLRDCAECTAEIEKMETPLRLFRGAVREWSASQEHSAMTIPARRPSGILWMRIAAVAALLVVLVAVGIRGFNQHQAGVAQEDEVLLGQVQADLSRSVPATMEPLYKLMASEESAR